MELWHCEKLDSACHGEWGLHRGHGQRCERPGLGTGAQRGAESVSDGRLDQDKRVLPWLPTCGSCPRPPTSPQVSRGRRFSHGPAWMYCVLFHQHSCSSAAFAEGTRLQSGISTTVLPRPTRTCPWFSGYRIRETHIIQDTTCYTIRYAIRSRSIECCGVWAGNCHPQGYPGKLGSRPTVTSELQPMNPKPCQHRAACIHFRDNLL